MSWHVEVYGDEPQPLFEYIAEHAPEAGDGISKLLGEYTTWGIAKQTIYVVEGVRRGHVVNPDGSAISRAIVDVREIS